MLDQLGSGYSFKLLMAAKGSGAYLADVSVRVTSQPAGELMLDTRTEGQVDAFLDWAGSHAHTGRAGKPWFLDQVDGHSRLDRMEQALRACTLCFTRLGPPDELTRTRMLARVEPWFPATDRALNSELCQLLVYLQSPRVAAAAPMPRAAAPLLRTTRLRTERTEGAR